MESLFRCPVAGRRWTRGDRAYRCPAGHSYDIAREGYTYLLPPIKSTPPRRGMTGYGRRTAGFPLQGVL